MSKIHKSIAELVGNTPLVELSNYEEKYGIEAHIIGKLEYLNPTGSVKDRLALALIEDGKKKGLIKKGDTLVDVTSGNTGIGHAEGFEFVPYLEPGTSEKRKKIFKGYGLDVHTLYDIDEVKDFEKTGLVLDDLIHGIQRIAKENGWYYTGQTVNEANQEYHYKTTGPEIWRDTDGNIDYFLAMGGTAGTIVGVGRFLREKKIRTLKSSVSRPRHLHARTAPTLPGTLSMERFLSVVSPTR